MNMPNIHPTLTLTDPEEGRVIDQVFQLLPACIRDNKYNCDVYITDGDSFNAIWHVEKSKKELSIEDARKWWNTCVKKGYVRK